MGLGHAGGSNFSVGICDGAPSTAHSSGKFHLGLYCLPKYLLGISSIQTVEGCLRKPQCEFLNVIQSVVL